MLPYCINSFFRQKSIDFCVYCKKEGFRRGSVDSKLHNNTRDFKLELRFENH